MMNIFAGKSSPSHMQIRAQSILVQMLEKECSLVYGGQSENENFPDEDYSDDNVDEDFTAADSEWKDDVIATSFIEYVIIDVGINSSFSKTL